MSTYLVSFEQMLKFTKIMNEDAHRGVYWDAYDKFVIECPAVTGKGESQGFTWRTEIMKSDLAEFVLQRYSAMNPSDVGEIIRIFERTFLSVFTKVYGEYIPELDQLEEEVQYFSTPPE
jgi:hypothetical protein